MTAKVPQIKVLTRHTTTIQIDPNIILCLGPWKHVRPSGRTRHGTIFAAIMHYMHQILISPVMSAVGRTHSGMILVDSEHGVGAVTLPDETDVHCHAVVVFELHGTGERRIEPTRHRERGSMAMRLSRRKHQVHKVSVQGKHKKEASVNPRIWLPDRMLPYTPAHALARIRPLPLLPTFPLARVPTHPLFSVPPHPLSHVHTHTFCHPPIHPISGRDCLSRAPTHPLNHLPNNPL